jgi:CheY-like chemotaxis protein
VRPDGKELALEKAPDEKPLIAGNQLKAAAPLSVHRRILIIDDSWDIASTLRDVLATRGHRAEVATDGVSAATRARALQPEVVICDIGMPGMSGYDVARAFRADPSLKHICLVAFSGYAGPEDVERCRKAGFDHFLPKPVALETLEALLASVVEGL